MKRILFAVLGVGLLVLWVFGMTRAGTAGWITAWLDALAAVWSFALAVSAGGDRTEEGRTSRMAATLCLSGGLFALWALDLAGGVAGWLSWWNFGFAAAFLVTGILPDRIGSGKAQAMDWRKSA